MQPVKIGNLYPYFLNKDFCLRIFFNIPAVIQIEKSVNIEIVPMLFICTQKF
ncbi:hypothetical protein SDC9_194445 [bioreactor metagenome]|uniref:Uncharacterized protein n=1 Tax=bioreactor metagenome TaxID=1076179 RepID=A0A645I7H2_9ZZZZ